MAKYLKIVGLKMYIAIKNGVKVIGVMLKNNEKRIDIGTPESYMKVLTSLY